MYICLLAIFVGVIVTSNKIMNMLQKQIHRDFISSIEMHKEGMKRTKFPIIKIKIRNKYKFFLVDTGANVNILDINEYEKIVGDGEVFASDESYSITGVDTVGNSVPSPTVIEEIDVNGNIYVENFCVLDTWTLAKDQISKISGLPIVGILGTSFFIKAKCSIDFDNSIIWIKE